MSATESFTVQHFQTLDKHNSILLYFQMVLEFATLTSSTQQLTANTIIYDLCLGLYVCIIGRIQYMIGQNDALIGMMRRASHIGADSPRGTPNRASKIQTKTGTHQDMVKKNITASLFTKAFCLFRDCAVFLRCCLFEKTLAAI